MSKKLFGWLACLIICASVKAGAPAPDQAQQEETDSITRLDGRTFPVTEIKSEDYVEVSYVIKGFKQKTPSYEVKDVIRVKADGDYVQAQEKMQEGKYRVAALKFTTALKAMDKQNWAIEYCNYGIGNALYEGREFNGFTGKSGITYAPASVYYRKVLEANPKSRFLPDISVKLPECLMKEEKFDEADKELKKAENSLKAYNDEILRVLNQRDTAKKYLAKLAVVEAQLAERKAEKNKGEGDWQAALDKWQSVCGGKTVDYPDLRAEALEGKLSTLLKMKDYAQAEAEATNIIEKFGKEGDAKLLPVLPGAYFVRGQAALMRAVDLDAHNLKNQANDFYANARWDFIHVLAQFFDSEDYVAQAYFAAGLCCDKLRDIEKADAGEKALHYWKAVVTNFPNSPLKENAQKEIARVTAAALAPKADKPKDAPAAPKGQSEPPKTPAPKADKPKDAPAEPKGQSEPPKTPAPSAGKAP